MDAWILQQKGFKVSVLKHPFTIFFVARQLVKTPSSIRRVTVTPASGSLFLIFFKFDRFPTTFNT